jgi:DNA helicase-2/ATP-dependent DNA helicase PcrA
MTPELESLNESQRAAVDWVGGPLLVLAGPGSGKTKVLTLRIAKLLAESTGQRFRILGLTFTDKAAAEMRTRVIEYSGQQAERTLLTTFHSFSADILRQHGSHIGLRPDFVILSQNSDREGVLEDAVEALVRKGEDFSSEDAKLLPAIDRLLAQCVPVEKAADYFGDTDVGVRVKLLYGEYRNVLRSTNRLDFPSLLLCVHELLAQQPAVPKLLRTVYPHICVDEFQDTNQAQYQILRALVADKPHNLFVVADDDQIIYQWNGASPARLKKLQDDYQMATIQLPANYRCPPEVIECANKLIRHNMDRSPTKQPIVAMRSTSGGQAVRVEEFGDEHQEARWVAEDIAVQHAGHTGSCVVLARGKRLIDDVVKSLGERGVPASQSVRKSEFDSRGPVAWLHAALRLANARGDKEQLRRLCKGFYELEGVSLSVPDVAALGDAYGGDYLRAFISTALRQDRLEKETRQFLTAMEKVLAEKLDFIQFSRVTFGWFDIRENALAGQAAEGFVDYRGDRTAWEALQADIIGKFGVEDITLNAFLQEMDLREKSTPIPPDAVRCLTIHSAKGLEWDHVYIVGFAEDQMPSFQSIKQGANSREMQEERRNCFVAITRAKVSLTLTYARQYMGWARSPSRFLREMELLPYARPHNGTGSLTAV